MGATQAGPVSGAARAILAAGALFDLLFSLPIAVPALSAGYIDLLHAINAALGDLLPRPEFGPIELIFANMFGVSICIWAIMRLVQPSAAFAFYDIWMRAGVTMIFLNYALSGTGPIVMYFFLILDIFWTAANIWAYRNWRKPVAALAAP